MTGTELRALCLPGMQDPERRSRIQADTAKLAAEEVAMRAAMSAQTHRAFRSPAPFTEVTRADMSWFYENRLRDSAKGSVIWAEILALGGRLCPLCHLTKPRTIEHSYPQSKFPRLAVEPWNLVPACRDCNSERLVGHGTITISPYVDDWAVDTPWLTAQMLDPLCPADLRFDVAHHPSLNQEQYDAIRQFADDIDILDRYVGLAIEAFGDFLATLRLDGPVPPTEQIVRSLDERVRSHRLSFGENRWQTVAFTEWHRRATEIDWPAL